MLETSSLMSAYFRHNIDVFGAVSKEFRLFCFAFFWAVGILNAGASLLGASLVMETHATCDGEVMNSMKNVCASMWFSLRSCMTSCEVYHRRRRCRKERHLRVTRYRMSSAWRVCAKL